MMVTLSSNAIGDFISYSGNSASEFLLTYRGELIDEYCSRRPVKGGLLCIEFTHSAAILYEALTPSHSLRCAL